VPERKAAVYGSRLGGRDDEPGDATS
jgi:hypothetical protein